MPEPKFTYEERVILAKHEREFRYKTEEKQKLRDHEKLLGLPADIDWDTQIEEARALKAAARQLNN